MFSIRTRAMLALDSCVRIAAASPISALALGNTGLTDEQISYLEPLAAVPVGLALGAAS